MRGPGAGLGPPCEHDEAQPVHRQLRLSASRPLTLVRQSGVRARSVPVNSDHEGTIRWLIFILFQLVQFANGSAFAPNGKRCGWQQMG
jgi:hypothetical protein